MPPPSSRASYRTTFAVLIIAVTAFALIQSLIQPELGGLARHFGTDRPTVTWLLTAYLLSASVCTPLLGRLGDVWGKQRVLVGCLAALAVGCGVSALAPDLWWMVAGRAIQGIGGGIMPASFGIIRDEFPEKRFPLAISVTSSLLAFGIGCGIVISGPLVDLLGYRSLFWLPCGVGAVAAAVAFRVVPASPTRSGGRIRLGPALGLAGWLSMLVLGISQAPRWGWRSGPVIALLVAAAVIVAGWVRAESRSPDPLVDIGLMRRRGVWTANLVALLVGFGLYSTGSLVPQLAQTDPHVSGFGLGASVTGSGLMMLPSCLVSFAVGIAAAPAAARVGSRRLIALGCLVGAGGIAILAGLHRHAWQICLGAGMNGFGTGLTLALLATIVVAAVPRDRTGVATGMNANIRTIGGAVGSAVLATVLAANPGVAGAPAQSGYVIGLLTIAGVYVTAGLVAAVAVPGAARRTATSGPGDRPVFWTPERRGPGRAARGDAGSPAHPVTSGVSAEPRRHPA